ncbi:hypothetical protein KSP40_PGU013274 [Platanthera guangdongensis]|uniref:Rho GTPase activating protein n=1 Tax=Platanthera guangdongensis TaxID=2320717 RepID=A0ABR2LPJ7_9ASPA
MTRFHLHLRFLSPSPLFYCASVDGAEDEVFDKQIEADSSNDMISSPLISTATEEGDCGPREDRRQQFSILDIASAVLRKSLVMCSSLGAAEKVVDAAVDISWPTDLRHVSHVTFDRFDGFLGLPPEFQVDIPSEVPSASVSVFGVSAESMQCSHDSRGNSVPTILLSMQRHLYSQGGLKAEGIFRINAENEQEMLVREQLNKGVVPYEVDLHCLAGLIKAWFRELPSGVLDSLTAEQVMHCNTEEDCHQLVMVLPPTESALLDWAINLMSDVVEHEHYSKMNARNIAMVFAPNMTQMADPLTALIHAVQVMNFLKTLVMMTLRERQSTASEINLLCSCYSTLDGSDSESFQSFEKRSEVGDGDFFSGRCSLAVTDFDGMKDGSNCGHGNGDAECFLLNTPSLGNRVQKLCSHPVFQLSRPRKKAGEMDEFEDLNALDQTLVVKETKSQ